MKSFLFTAWLFSCLIAPSLSSPAGISQTRLSLLDSELRAVLNVSGFLSLQPSKNTTHSSSVRFPISALINLVISPSEASDLPKPIADWDDALIQEREPVFRKDYALDDQKLGWYKFHRVPEKWDDARERCELEGAVLASPLNPQMLQAMKNKMQTVFSVLTGIHSIFSYGDYYSINGVPLGEMPVEWSPTLSSDNDKRCVILYSDSTITNVKCDSVSPYICYKANDYTPLTACGTTDVEYTLNNQLNTCYKLHSEIKGWQDAFKTCSAEGGHLVVINDDVELATVVQLFSKDTAAENNMDYCVHVGIVLRQSTGEWVTIFGEKLKKSGFSTWSGNYQGNRGNWGALKRSGLIDDYTQGLPFVCEKKPDSLVTTSQLFDITNKPIDI